MRKYLYIFLVITLFLSLAGKVRAEGEEPGADFSFLAEYSGAKYTITYPGKGYHRHFSILIKRIDTIISFVEAYGATELKNINIIITESTGQLESGLKSAAGEFRTEGEQIYIDLPAGYYNDNVVVHEVCHLLQIPFWFPAWFGEGHAENCARKYYESRGESDRVQVYNDWYGARIEKLKNVVAEVPKYIGQEDFGPRDVVAKSALNSYLLMGELAKTVGMAKIFPKIRQDFVVDENGVKKPYIELIPNDALICKINEASPKNVIPLFEKYGFTAPLCDEKTYAFLAPKASLRSDVAGWIIIAGFWTVIILVVVKLIKKYRKK